MSTSVTGLATPSTKDPGRAPPSSPVSPAEPSTSSGYVAPKVPAPAKKPPTPTTPPAAESPHHPQPATTPPPAHQPVKQRSAQAPAPVVQPAPAPEALPVPVTVLTGVTGATGQAAPPALQGRPVVTVNVKTQQQVSRCPAPATLPHREPHQPPPATPLAQSLPLRTPPAMSMSTDSTALPQKARNHPPRSPVSSTTASTALMSVAELTAAPAPAPGQATPEWHTAPLPPADAMQKQEETVISLTVMRVTQPAPAPPAPPAPAPTPAPAVPGCIPAIRVLAPAPLSPPLPPAHQDSTGIPPIAVATMITHTTRPLPARQKARLSAVPTSRTPPAPVVTTPAPATNRPTPAEQGRSVQII